MLLLAEILLRWRIKNTADKNKEIWDLRTCFKTWTLQSKFTSQFKNNTVLMSTVF